MSLDPAATMAEAAALIKRAADLIAEGRLDEAETADRQARTLRNRALHQARRAGATRVASRDVFSPAQSDRNTVIEGLTELDAIASPRLLSDYVAARFATSVNPRTFSSLRRDERKAWSRPGGFRPVFVLPALDGARFLPLRGFLSLSTWPMWRRLVGPRTGLVELLRAAANILEQRIWLAESDEAAAQRTDRLLASLVRTIPGALDGWSLRASDRIKKAIERELGELYEADARWRQDAAGRAEAQLDQSELLFGARPPHLIAGTGVNGR